MGETKVIELCRIKRSAARGLLEPVVTHIYHQRHGIAGAFPHLKIEAVPDALRGSSNARSSRGFRFSGGARETCRFMVGGY